MAGPGAHDRTVARGALINTFGAVGKAVLLAAFFLLGARLYGAAPFGVFYLVFTMIGLAVSFTVAGFADGILMFASRYVDQPDDQDELYRVMANCLVITLGLAALLIGLIQLLGPALIAAFFPQPGVLEAAWLLRWALPFLAITYLAIAATKARLTMKWDALLNGLVGPVMLSLLALVFHLFAPGLRGLLWAYLAAQAALAACALLAFGRYYSFGRLGRALIRLRFSRELLGFSLPQNLNLTFTNLITYFDVLMLGAFGLAPALITVYGMGAQLVRTVRQLKLVFSGSLAPVIARLHARGDRRGLSQAFSTVANWITTLGLPAILVLAALRADLLALFVPGYAGPTTFMLVLLAVPALVCTLDLAGNIVVMTGHSGWNLFNSFVVAGLNVGLNWVLIRLWGMVGAAAATALATAVISVLQLVEARVLAGARLEGRLLYKPLVAVLPGIVILIAARLLSFDGSLALRLGLAAVAVALYGLSLVALRASWFGLRSSPSARA